MARAPSAAGKTRLSAEQSPDRLEALRQALAAPPRRAQIRHRG